MEFRELSKSWERNPKSEWVVDWIKLGWLD